MRNLARIAVLGTLAASLVGIVPADVTSAQPSQVTHRLSTIYLLNHIPVKAQHHAAYERSAFKLWDSRGNGCDTRDAVLIRDAVRKPHVGAGCSLSHGKWFSPYDGFTATNSTKIQIDHVVPLSDAWAAGAWKWNSNTRERYANDMGTRYDLLAVSAHSNESKSDRAPDEYLPPRSSYDCKYMTEYTAVLWRWHLSYNRHLKHFLHRHLAACGWPKISEPKRPTISTQSSGGSNGGGTPTPTPTSHACTTTSSGSCIRSGEFCPQADYGQTGYDAYGNQLVCTGDHTHPHWE